MQYLEIKKLDQNYPPLLREMADPPERIFVRGDISCLNTPCIAIVGTRKATEEGRVLAKKVAKDLVGRGFIIVSGLALGIDTAAHEGAVLGNGITIAVLGNGIDAIYPARNENLAKKILDSGGAIISEYEPGTPSFPSQFLERNRIVAGLCLATIVIEAPQRSGALATARMAAEAGREVFVFPGPAGHPQWQGSHALIRDGARLVHSTADILEDLSASNTVEERSAAPLFRKQNNFAPAAKFSSPSARPPALKSFECSDQAGAPAGCSSKAERRIVSPTGVPKTFSPKSSHEAEQIISVLRAAKSPLQVDKIIETTKLTAQEANQILTELLVCGIVEETAFGYKLKM